MTKSRFHNKLQNFIVSFIECKLELTNFNKKPFEFHNHTGLFDHQDIEKLE
jgi:hypothetical protein